MTPSSVQPQPVELPSCLLRSGFNVAGVLSAEAFDDLVPEAWKLSELLPGARCVLVLGCGGPNFFRALKESPRRELLESPNPVEAFAASVSQQAAEDWNAGGHETRAIQALDRRALPGEPAQVLDFVALARACGLGSPSRLGLLLHPEFGPWLALRSLLVTKRFVGATPPLAGPGACEGCPAPCTRVCPASAPGAAGFDTLACSAMRSERPGCRTRCDARHACVVGQAYAYDSAAEEHHMLASLSATFAC